MSLMQGSHRRHEADRLAALVARPRTAVRIASTPVITCKERVGAAGIASQSEGEAIDASSGQTAWIAAAASTMASATPVEGIHAIGPPVGRLGILRERPPAWNAGNVGSRQSLARKRESASAVGIRCDWLRLR